MPNTSLEAVTGRLGVGAIAFLGMYLAVDGLQLGVFELVETYGKSVAWGILGVIPTIVVTYIIGVFCLEIADTALSRSASFRVHRPKKIIAISKTGAHCFSNAIRTTNEIRSCSKELPFHSLSWHLERWLRHPTCKATFQSYGFPRLGPSHSPLCRSYSHSVPLGERVRWHEASRRSHGGSRLMVDHAMRRLPFALALILVFGRAAQAQPQFPPGTFSIDGIPVQCGSVITVVDSGMKDIARSDLRGRIFVNDRRPPSSDHYQAVGLRPRLRPLREGNQRNRCRLLGYPYRQGAALVQGSDSPSGEVLENNTSNFSIHPLCRVAAMKECFRLRERGSEALTAILRRAGSIARDTPIRFRS